MNLLLLHPTDVLFFRDGRPMTGSLAGHGAAWPLPTVTDAALHAALHRSDLPGHAHDHRRQGQRVATDVRKFGSLTHAGPFPVDPDGTWYFPRPADLLERRTRPALRPIDPATLGQNVDSSLPTRPALYPVANRLAPDKSRRPPAWLRASAWERYLAGTDSEIRDGEAVEDSGFSDTESAVGIAIDEATGTTGQGSAEGMIYSAQYLRLRDRWALGILASTREKVANQPEQREDLVSRLFPNKGRMVVGGQQRVCTVSAQSADRAPLPTGRGDGFSRLPDGRCAVKWVLLTPAVFPSYAGAAGLAPHPGGWLPNWIEETTGQVLLKDGGAAATARQPRESREAWRRRVAALPPLTAHLVAALVPKPIPVTGWALPNPADPDRAAGGAKPTLLAVPAGAVYYFACPSPEAARALAEALNWHGASPGPEIRNRRSTLLGEKGFGLGVCGTWEFHQASTLGQPQ